MKETITFEWEMCNIEQYIEHICCKILNSDIVSSTYYDPNENTVIVTFKDEKQIKFVFEEIYRRKQNGNN